jgi:hypothetical protein
MLLYTQFNSLYNIIEINSHKPISTHLYIQLTDLPKDWFVTLDANRACFYWCTAIFDLKRKEIYYGRLDARFQKSSGL